jgi:hypothetical protein
MICIDFDLLGATLKFWPPVAKGSYNSKHFLVIDLIVELSRGHSLREVANRVLVAIRVFLGEHTSDYSV